MSGNTKEYAEEIKSPHPFHRAVHVRVKPNESQFFTATDTRDFTQRFFGDPIPGDKRRELFPGVDTSRTDWKGLAR